MNNDGFSDVIVGAPNYNNQTCRAYIYFGGSNMDSLEDITMTGEGNLNSFGLSVSGAGDVNNDGYSDVIVGAYGYNSLKGRAYIYYGGSSMDNIPDVTLTGSTDESLGGSVSGAGDVNGDGYSDVIVGAQGSNSGTGRAYVYYGGSPMNNIPDVTLTGESAHEYFGTSVSNAGDVNGDGYSDVIVGAFSYNSNTGRAYIYYGGSNMDNTADITLTGESPNDYFSLSISGAGDVNNDGYSDVIVGAYGYNSNTGRAYIYSDNSALPVELTDLIANKDNDEVDLHWETQTEVNNYGFEIQREDNSQNKNLNNWIKIGFVNGSGNSNSPKSYSFQDKEPQIGEEEYRLKQIDNDGKISYSKIVDVSIQSPKKYELLQNYPNPFNPSTRIDFQIPKSQNVEIKVFDILGKEIKTLLNGYKKAGKYSIEFSGNNLPSGIYFYRIKTNEYVNIKKMILVK